MLYVIIATCGRSTLLGRTLRSLAECDPPAAFGGTIVVENGDQQQGTERVVRGAASSLHAEYLFHPEANKSGALNAALKRVGDGLVVFLDDDVVVGRSLLTAYEAAAAGLARGVFFGGPVFPDYEVPPPDWLVDYLPPSARGWRLDQADELVTSPIFLGANWAAFVEDLAAAGGFDPWFGPGAATGGVGQEWAMLRRLLANGLRGRYVGGAEVWHWVPRHRCSPRWALRRSYRRGIRSGLTGDAPIESARICGFPRWALRRALEGALRALLCSLHPRRRVRFQAMRESLFSLGYLKGSRFAYARRDAPVEMPARNTSLGA